MKDFTESQLEIVKAVSEYLDVFDQDPLEDNQIYGCDCGCGGDEVDSEELDSYYEAFDQALRKLHRVFEKHDV